jgi:hypothetical protein
MFAMQANDQFALQTVVVLITVNRYPVYNNKIKAVQSFLERFVFENG